MVVGSPTKLNLIPSGVMPVVYINQGDAGYDKEFLIYNGDSPYNVPSGVSATIRGTKADGYGVTEAAALTEGSNLVTVTITEQMVAAAGANLYELVFVDTDGLRIATINMAWAVKVDALGEAVISDSDLDYVSQAMDRIQGADALKNQIDINTANIAENAEDIAAETAARIAADNTLQSNISIEASARAAQDNSLQAQINQLVAPSGAAPSAAEVQNARIGADGVTYASLGDAIRTQDTNLINYITHREELYRNIVDESKLTLAEAWICTDNEYTGTNVRLALKFSRTNPYPIAPAFEENTQYTISLEAYTDATTTAGIGIIVAVIYTDATEANIVLVPNSAHSYGSFSGTTAANKTIDKVFFTYGSGNNTWHIKNFQIEKGTVKTDYVPYMIPVDNKARDEIVATNVRIDAANTDLGKLSDYDNTIIEKFGYLKLSDIVIEQGTTGEQAPKVFDNIYLKAGKYTLECYQNKTLTSVTRNTFQYNTHNDTSDRIIENPTVNYHLEKGLHSWEITISTDGYYDITYWIHTPSEKVEFSLFSIGYSYSVYQEIDRLKTDVSSLQTGNNLEGYKNEYRYLVPTFEGAEKQMIILGTNDLRTFDILAKRGETYVCSNQLMSGVYNTIRDPAAIQIGEYYYFTYTIGAFATGYNTIGFCRTKDFHTWEELPNLSVFGEDTSIIYDKIWAPSWFRDGKTVYVVCTAFSGSNASTVIMKYSPDNHALSDGHAINGLHGYDYHIYKEGTIYYILGVNNYVYSSNSLTGAWTLVSSSDEATEAQFAIRLDNGKWRIYRQELEGTLGTAHMIYSDVNSLSDAIPTGTAIGYTDEALQYIRSINGNKTTSEYYHFTVFDFMNRNDNNNNYTV